MPVKETPMALMHINGYPGCGKTTLGQKLKETFKGKIIVKDLDDFLTIKSTKRSMELAINKFLNLHTRPIVFIGTAVNEPLLKLYPKIPAKYQVWMDVSLRDSTKQAMNRQVDMLCNDKPAFLKMIQTMSEHDLDNYLKTFYNFHTREHDWSPLHPLCTKLGYKTMTKSKISQTIRQSLSLH